MARNYQRIVEKLVHESVEDLEPLTLAEYEDKDGPLTEEEQDRVFELYAKAHVLVYW